MATSRELNAAIRGVHKLCSGLKSRVELSTTYQATDDDLKEMKRLTAELNKVIRKIVKHTKR